MRGTLCIAFIVFALSYPAVAQQQPASAVPVGAARVERKPIAKAGEFVGRVEAISRVEIRARVTGYLEEVLFNEGDLITEGAPLYRIEKGLFQAQVELAEAALGRSKAAKTLSAQQLARAEELLGKQSGTVAARDQAGAQDQQAQAGVMADEATVTIARSTLVTPTSYPQLPERSAAPISPKAMWSARAAVPHRHRQPGSDVCEFSGQSKRVPSRAGGGRAGGYQQHQSSTAFCRSLDVSARRRNQLCRRAGRSRHRHDPGAGRVSKIPPARSSMGNLSISNSKPASRRRKW